MTGNPITIPQDKPFQYIRMKKIIGICLVALIANSCQRAERETYLIPSDFTGRVQIIFNQNGIPVKYQNEYGRDTTYTPKVGAPIKYENGRRLYEIPENGILLTQFKDNYGFINRTYFSVDKKGNRLPLEVYELDHYKRDSTRWVVKDKNKKGIFGDGTSGSYGNMNVAFQDFIVSSANTLDSFYKKEYKDKFMINLNKAAGLGL